MRAMVFAAVLAAVPGAAAAQTSDVQAPESWGQALAEDARAFHDLIAANHPGPVDALNPGFGALLEDGLDLALSRAETAEGFPAWYFALQQYQASFDDGHLSLGDYQLMGHVWRPGWPGFLTGLRADGETERHEVVFSAAADVPPVGAILRGCDGQDAATLAANRVGRFSGRWDLRSRRARLSANLFVDRDNPYAPAPRTCLFEVAGETRAYDLDWRDFPVETREAAFAAAGSPRYFAPIELREWSEGLWIGLGSFDSDPASEAGQQLTALLAEVEARRDEIRAAPVVVFDLRGNNGGSSLWSNRIARTLWGEDRVDALGPRSEGVDWRVSPGNLAVIESYRDDLFADEPEAREWAAQIATGMSQALNAGAPLWRQSDDEPRPAAPTSSSPMLGRVYVLADYGCASACLDAMDILLAMGATPVGQETSGDTVYMDIREDLLPSGRAMARIPMKVYRGRPRGNNETVRPDHAWTGDLSDTAGIEAFIAGLD